MTKSLVIVNKIIKKLSKTKCNNLLTAEIIGNYWKIQKFISVNMRIEK